MTILQECVNISYIKLLHNM